MNRLSKKQNYLDKGWVFITTNNNLRKENLFKIGKTIRPHSSLQELNEFSYDRDDKFYFVKRWYLDNYRAVGKALCEIYRNFRKCSNIFRLSDYDIIKIDEEIKLPSIFLKEPKPIIDYPALAFKLITILPFEFGFANNKFFARKKKEPDAEQFKHDAWFEYDEKEFKKCIMIYSDIYGKISKDERWFLVHQPKVIFDFLTCMCSEKLINLDEN